jgi:hypothetical protein
LLSIARTEGNKLEIGVVGIEKNATKLLVYRDRLMAVIEGAGDWATKCPDDPN